MCPTPNHSEAGDQSDADPVENPSLGEDTHSETNASDADNAQAAGADVDDSATESSGEPTIEQQLVEAIAARDESHNRWLRCRAEVENVQKRAYREMLELRQFQVLPLVRDLLPVLDNLHRALAAAESSQSVEDLVQGMQMVLQQFQGIIAGHSVSPIEAVGETFDPNVHEAIQQRPSADHPPNIILDEVEQGFRMHDRVIRPSKVIVSSQPPAAADETSQPEEDGA